ncbi:conjugal transfer protein TraD [Psychrilyobacter atlanticus]|uniref:conjugal transfer protein TraD n=1 Tax=Psychrilyobacter atlanticus TaxID=271091 RepID=UPI000401BC1F|nr:conjugal transfer protein TraD [Psychrilyobacter atlanticus]
MKTHINLSLKEEQISYKLKKLSMKRNKILQDNKYKSRKDRGRKLLMIGILMEKAGILTQGKEILLGYFLEFKKRSQLKILEPIGKKLLKKEEIREAPLFHLTTKEKKERAYKLISKGALIEKAGLLKENKAILGGYFVEFHNCNSYELQRFYEIGIVEFKKHKN